VTIISCDVEISIVGNGGEMVRLLSLGQFFFSFSFLFYIMYSLLGTRTRMRR